MKIEAAVGAARPVDACSRFVPRMLPPARAVIANVCRTGAIDGVAWWAPMTVFASGIYFLVLKS